MLSDCERKTGHVLRAMKLRPAFISAAVSACCTIVKFYLAMMSMCCNVVSDAIISMTVKGFLKNVVAGDLPVRPVVLYPGWFVKPQPKGCEVRVLHPDALPGFLKNEGESLDKRDIQAIEACLSVYVRNSGP